jgi:hypothetical protein
MSNEFPKMQQLMDQAYERWQANNWSQAEFWAQLSYPERVTVFVGNLNYQVENGGFYQWHDNGYSECHRDLIVILRMLGDIGKKVSSMVEKAMREVSNNRRNERSSRWDDEDDDDWYDVNYHTLSKYDDEFYTINQVLLAETEAFVSKLV